MSRLMFSVFLLITINVVVSMAYPKPDPVADPMADPVPEPNPTPFADPIPVPHPHALADPQPQWPGIDKDG